MIGLLWMMVEGFKRISIFIIIFYYHSSSSSSFILCAPSHQKKEKQYRYDLHLCLFCDIQSDMLYLSFGNTGGGARFLSSALEDSEKNKSHWNDLLWLTENAEPVQSMCRMYTLWSCSYLDTDHYSLRWKLHVLWYTVTAVSGVSESCRILDTTCWTDNQADLQATHTHNVLRKHRSDHW